MRKFYFALLGVATLIAAVSCTDSIVSECEITLPEDSTFTATFPSIQEEIFNKTCATADCHGSPTFPAGNLDLTEGYAYNNLVNVASISGPGGMPRVDPGAAENSWLIKRLEADGAPIMPPQNAGDPLRQNIIDSIKVWINNGALQNN